MALTLPMMTAVAGSIFTAAQFNTYLGANITHLANSPANRCDAYHSTTQSIASGASAALNLNSEDLDTAAMHDLVSDNERIEIPAGAGGRYIVFGSTRFQQASGTLVAHLALQKNGSTVRYRSVGCGDGAPQHATVGSLSLLLAAGDYVNLHVDAVGGNATVGSVTASEATRLEVIGPLPAA